MDTSSYKVFTCAARWKDTEHQCDQCEQRHPQTQVSYPVLLLGLGQSVGQGRLQAHKQHAGGESHSSADVVEDLGIIHLRAKDANAKHN